MAKREDLYCSYWYMVILNYGIVDFIFLLLISLYGTKSDFDMLFIEILKPEMERNFILKLLNIFPG